MLIKCATIELGSVAVLESKICARCGDEKEAVLFVKKGNNDYRSWCKDCENSRRKLQYLEQREYRTKKARETYAKNPEKQLIASQKWREKNKEKYAAYVHSWYKNNPDNIRRSRIRRNAKKRNAGIFLVTTKEFIKLKQQPCFYCGSKNKIEIDHRVPISRGGAHSIGNLVAACIPCNRSKNNKFVSEWKNYKRKLENARQS
jgi:5-methylcytosine-specific restriction endonuclease McrA